MSVYPVFEKYCAMIKKHGGEVTYTKEEYELKYGEPKEFEPMVITPRNQKRPMKATFENSEKKASTPKKPKAQRAPREELTQEQRKQKAREVYAIKAQERIAMGLTTRGTQRAPRPLTTVEQSLKERLVAWTKQKRQEWKEAGLTSHGKPYKVKGEKPEPTTEETKAKRREYARTYRTKNREKHLAYRRNYRKKCNEEKSSMFTLQEAS